MKPFKTGIKLSEWVLRLATAIFVTILFFSDLKTFNFHSRDFYIGSGIILFGVLLFIGNFSSKHTLTMLSGLGLFVLCVVKIVLMFNGTLNVYFVNIVLPASIGFYYFCKGNQ
jgi:ABC-type polysaccharide/polyol phosphate export permease